MTTLELALKASSVIGKGATDLPVIFAMGGADSFSSLMSFRGSSARQAAVVEPRVGVRAAGLQQTAALPFAMRRFDMPLMSITRK